MKTHNDFFAGSRRILLGAACFLASVLFISCRPPTELPGSAEEALLAYWAGLPSPPGLSHHILQAWPGVPPPADTLDEAPVMEIWCVETRISAPEDPAVDGELLIWIVVRENRDARWTATLLAAMSSLWPYEACGEARLGGPTEMIRARFAVYGHSPEQAAEGLPFLLEEFCRRPWLRNPTASWDQAGRRLLVTIESDAPNPAAGAKGLYDEVWD